LTIFQIAMHSGVGAGTAGNKSHPLEKNFLDKID